MTEPIALIDMDGTLCDYEGAMNEGLRAIAAPGEKMPENFDEDIPEYMKNRQSLIKKQVGWWENLRFTDFGQKILSKLRELKFELHILTKGPWSTTSAWTEKVKWCRTNVPDASITITEDKGLVYGRVLVDDYPGYIERWLEWRPRGTVIMPSYPYNAGFEHPNVFRYRGPSDDPQLQLVLEEVRKRD